MQKNIELSESNRWDFHDHFNLIGAYDDYVSKSYILYYATKYNYICNATTTLLVMGGSLFRFLNSNIFRDARYMYGTLLIQGQYNGST